jgi:predicted MFS family arabinose efflux permease
MGFSRDERKPLVSHSSPSRQEIKAVTILALGFGLVGVDRYLISTMYPLIAKDLHLGLGDIGTITGSLAIAWSISALFMGNLSDRIGRRRILVAALLVFALLIGASGLATSLMGLVAVRLVMGLADGGFTPASISATIEASALKRRGRNIGFQQMTLTLFGLGFCPLAVAGLLHFVNWRWIFLVFSIPGFLIAWFTWRIIPGKETVANEEKRSSLDDWKAVLSYHNIPLLALGQLCWLVCLVCTSAFIPNFVTDHLHLGFNTMGIIMSAIGIGSGVGTVILPWFSDKIGRKPVMLISSLGACFMLILFNCAGANPYLLFATMFMVHFFNNSLITLTVGPLCAETVPPVLMATASGVVIAVGELFGGGLGTVIAGQAAEHFKDLIGIGRVLYLPVIALAAGFLICTQLHETLPKLAKSRAEIASDPCEELSE